MPRARWASIPARRAAGLVLTAGLMAGGTGCGAASPGSTTVGTTPGSGRPGRPPAGPPRDSFQGSIVSGTGAYAGSTGRVALDLHPQGDGPRRSASLRLIGVGCAGQSHCLDLSGILSGTLRSGPLHVPDAGHAYLLTGTGVIHPIGQVTASGGVQGTGFIAKGRETLHLTLTGASGSVTLRAQSSVVRGFTSP